MSRRSRTDSLWLRISASSQARQSRWSATDNARSISSARRRISSLLRARVMTMDARERCLGLLLSEKHFYKLQRVPWIRSRSAFGNAVQQAAQLFSTGNFPSSVSL